MPIHYGTYFFHADVMYGTIIQQCSGITRGRVLNDMVLVGLKKNITMGI